MKGRLILYIGVLAFAVVLDSKTPHGPAEWLIEVFLVWIATTFGGLREMVLVAAAASSVMFVGLWTSPGNSVGALLIEMLNRLAAIGFIWLVVHAARKRRIAEAEARVLRGLLPVCAFCRRIRRQDREWQSMESYIAEHSEAMFSHGVCPECFDKYYPELNESRR